MFGAWQVGAWGVLRQRFEPDLVVGASVGSLNGYLIASRIPQDELRHRWLTPDLARFHLLERNIKTMMAEYQPAIPFVVVLTDLLRMKPQIVQGDQITWRHIAASCALPGFLPQQRIGGRIYSDGGLLNALPVWVAADLGATRIVGLHVLPRLPSAWLHGIASVFKSIAGYNPPLPEGVEVQVISPSHPLGSPRDALYWKQEKIEEWLTLGAADASAAPCPLL